MKKKWDEDRFITVFSCVGVVFAFFIIMVLVMASEAGLIELPVK